MVLNTSNYLQIWLPNERISFYVSSIVEVSTNKMARWSVSVQMIGQPNECGGGGRNIDGSWVRPPTKIVSVSCTWGRKFGKIDPLESAHPKENSWSSQRSLLVMAEISLKWLLGFPILVIHSVADPGFPRGGGANSPGGRQHKILPNFPKNCMKLKEFGPRGRGARVPHAPS